MTKPNLPVIERFLLKVKIIESGCWEWTASKNRKGYGQFNLHKKIVRSQRLIYEYYYGQISPDLTIDHLCRNRACVNPLHLEQVTSKVNTLRGEGETAINSRKTHCVKGHEFTEENTRIDKNESRICRRCEYRRSKIKEEKKQIVQYAKNLLQVETVPSREVRV